MNVVDPGVPEAYENLTVVFGFIWFNYQYLNKINIREDTPILAKSVRWNAQFIQLFEPIFIALER